MWIFSTGGFISAVSHRDNDKLTMIRARDKMSLEEFLSSTFKGFVEAGKTEEETKAIMTTGTGDGMWEIYAVEGDYKWRVVMPKSAFGLGLAYEATHYVNYSNFKSKLTATRGDRWHDAAMKVWSAMFAITDKLKTGNPDVDNPRPFSSYHNDKGVSYYDKYPAPKGKGLSVWEKANAKKSPTVSEGTASGSETDWVDDALAVGYYDHDEETVGGTYRWGGNSLFQEDLEGYVDPDEKVWADGLHSFNGDDEILDGYIIDGRGDIVDGQFIGSSFLEEDLDHTPTDAELLAVEEAIAESWEQWDEETEFNTYTGETRSKIKDPLFDPEYKFGGSVHALTEAEWIQTQLAEGYAEQ